MESAYEKKGVSEGFSYGDSEQSESVFINISNFFFIIYINESFIGNNKNTTILIFTHIYNVFH